MAKQLNVSLGFTADNTQAKMQLQDLQNSLKKLSADAAKASGSNFGLTKDIAQATSKVAELQAALEGCKTSSGALDLGKFSQSLQKNQTSLKDYATALSQLGPQGEQAFAKLARSVTQAELPMRKANGVLAEFATTLKNTARWQISSSILHGFMGSVQQAYGYAKDLNESLNNIRIVTGQSVEQMDAFAAKANKAAKELSTTTTAYTDAALIFYQQGLNDKQVEERTNATIKMAHAAGENATEVSSYMTAIWNNFADGSKSLEYYGDVMAELGAKTAASSAEIAEGLEKFASIGETVGLSYEYAAAAVATVVDKTRQSADTVGTAFKTIFARLQGLQLGETLDDGTDLNKYSKALMSVGISIKDTNGELKNADVILDELGAKWQTLARDEQTALAQTVAGTRQYTQLMSLMNNYTDFKGNVSDALMSEGTLDQQAEIYAESWEAARDRVTAAAEEIYAQLLDDEFFISITDGFGKFLNVISNTIDSLGGLPGILSVVSSLMLKIFSNDIINNMQRWRDNWVLKSDGGLEQMLQQRRQANEELRKMFVDNADDGPVNQTKGNVYTEQANLQDTLITKQQELLAKGTQLTEEEQRRANIMLDINEAMGQRAIKAAEDLEAQEKANRALENQAKIQVKIASRKASNKSYTTFERDLKVAKELQAEYGTLQAIANKMSKSSDFNGTVQSLTEMSKAAQEAGVSFDRIDEILEQVKNGTVTDMETLSNAVETAMLDVGADGQMMFDQISSKAELAGVNMREFSPILDQMRTSFAQTGSLTAEQIQTLKDYGINVEEVEKKLKSMSGTAPTAAQGLVALGQTLSNVGMLANSVKGLFTTWNNEDMSFGEKLISTFTTLGMVIPLVTTAFKKQTIEQLAALSASILQAIGLGGLATTETLTKIATDGLTASTATFGATLYTVLWPIGLVMLAIGALVLIVWGLISAFKAAEANSPEGKLKAAEERAKELSKALDEAKEAAEDLKSAFDSYQDIADKLANCTEGTQEWTEALLENNQAVLDLMDKYPELSSMVNEHGQSAITRENGVLKIEDWAQEALIDQSNREVSAAYAASVRGKQDVRDAQINVERSRLPDLGNAYAEQIFNEVRSELGSSMTEDDFRAKLQEKTQWSDSVIESYVNKSGDLITAMNNLDASIQANTTATEAENLAIASEVLATNDVVQDSRFADEIIAAASQDYDKRLDEKEQALIDAGWGTEGISQADGANDEAKKIFDQYAQAVGLSGYELTDTWGNDDNREFVYNDAEGEEQVVSLEAMRAAVAASQANKDLAASAESLAAVFGKLEEAEAAAVSAALTGDTSGLSLKEIQNGIDASTLGLNQEDLNAMGYEGDYEAALAAFQADLDASLAVASDQWSKTLDNYSDVARGHMEAIGNSENEAINSISQATVEAYGTMLEGIQQAGGAAAADELAAGVTALMEENAGKAEEIMQAASGIDWSQGGEALDQLKGRLYEMGIRIDENSDAWKQFVAATEKINVSVVDRDLQSIREEITEIKELTEGIEIGSVISDEDYETLIAYNEGLREMFALTADGYMYVGGGDLTQMATEAALAKLEQTKADNEKALEAWDDLNDWGWKDGEGNFSKEDWYGLANGTDSNTRMSSMTNALVDNESAAIEALGYDPEYLKELASTIIDPGATADQVEQAKAILQAFYGEIITLKDNADAGLYDDSAAEEVYASQLNNVHELNAALNEGVISLDTYNKMYDAILSKSMTEASSLSELDSAAAAGGLSSTDEMYTQNLMRIAETYTSCKEELEAYQVALNNFDPNDAASQKALEQAEDTLRGMMTLEEAAEKYGLEVDSLAAQAEELRIASKDANGEMQLSAEQAAQMAVANQRMNKGLTSLVKGWKDWKKTLQSTEKTSQDYADTLADLSDAVTDLVSWYEDLALNSEFVEENMELIDKAATGDVNAIIRLGAAVANMTVANAELNSTFLDENGAMIDKSSALQQYANALGDGATAADAFAAAQVGVQAGFDAITANLDALQNRSMSLTDVLGGEQGLADWVAQLNAYASATGMTAAEMQQMLSSVGVTANVQTDYQEQEMTVPTYREEVTNITYKRMPYTFLSGDGQTYTGETVVPEYTKATVPAEPLKTTGFVEVASISMDGEGESPGVAAPTFTGRQAPSTSAKNGGSGGSGGGGGGSAPAAKEPVKKDTREYKKSGQETERYREINNLLENLTRKLDKVSEAKDRAFGKNKIALMKEEAKLLREQIALEQQKQQEILANLQNDKSKIQSNYGATFDEEGNVNNYDEMVQAQVDKYNAAYDAYIKAQNDAVNAYNASSRDDAAEAQYDERMEAIERTWEDAQEAYDQFTEDLDQYDETYDLFEESQITLNDIQNQLYDLALEEVEYKVQLKLDIEEDQMKVLDFLLGNLEDNAHDAAEAIAILTQQTESAMNNLATYEQGINDIFANHGLGSNAVTQFLNGTLTADDLANMEFTEAEVEKLREYRDGLLDETQNLIDYENAIREKVLTAWDDLVSKMDQGIEKLDHLTSMTESYKNIVDIVGKDMLGISDELMKSLDQATYDTALNKLEATSSKLDAMRASRQDAEDALAQARLEGNEDLVQYWEDTIATMDSEIDSAEEEFMSSWEESLQAAADMFANETEAIINEFSEKMAGAFGSTLEELQNAFSKQREINDLYVDDYKKIYELSKLSRDISKSVDETDNLAGKKALLAIQEEINKKQAEGVEMSEYEIENLRRKYELELAKMQLDEAKNTKSTVRMTRDNNGNWGYVYTADQDGVAAAEQNYEDKLYAMQEANSEYIKELEANIIQAEINMTEAMREIDATQYANAEEYYAACEAAAKPYYEMMEFYTNQMNLALGNNKQLYNGDWKEYSISTGYKISANEDFMDSFSETLLGQMTGYRSAEGYLQAHIEAVGSVDNPESLLGKLGTAYNGYSAKVDAAMEAAGTSTKNFAEHLDGYVNDEENGIAANAEKASASVEQAGKDMKDAMDKVISDVSNFSSKYGNKIQAIISKNTQLANSLNSVIAKWSELNGEEDGSGTTTTTTTTTTPTSTPTTTTPTTTPSTSGNTQSKSSSGDGSLSKGDVVTYTGGKYYADSYGGGASGSRGPGKKVTVTDIRDGRPYPIHVQSSDSAYGWLKKSQLSGFDTGGYTGVWGDQMGRLALLHQKELVLNENETKDMLQMIEMVREISSMIDLNAMSASQGLTGYLSSGRFSDGMMTIQQEVTIHAEFPDVSDRNEIKEAFGDLINMAAQYANRVK